MAYAAILYYKESKNEFSNFSKWIMAIIRTLAVFLLSFLLLNPLLKTVSRTTEKPVIIFAQDNSESIVTNSDSAFYRNQYPSLINSFLEKVGDRYAVDNYTFGENVEKGNSMDFSDNITDISSLFNSIDEKYSHRNVGAVVIASDGIINRGANPLYSSEKFNFPVFTIALGDTNFQKDVILTKVNYNRITYLGNEFPVEVLISANKCKDQNVQLLISKDDAVLFRKSISISSDRYDEMINLNLEAAGKGIQRYRIKLTPVDKEISVANNQQDIFIDVLEGKQKILFLADAPDPDIAAIKQAIKTNKNYVLDDFMITDFDKNVQEYSLVVLHGLPSAQNQIKDVLEKIDQLNTPVLYVVTKKISLPLFNNRNAGVVMRGDKIIYNEAQPSFDEKFTHFKLSEGTLRASLNFPPLLSPYGNIIVQPSAGILFYQKIGTVVTDAPLILLNENQGVKSGIIMGPGIWKWRLINYAKDGNHEAFDEIINKILQFLAVKVDKSFFRVYIRNNFTENEDVEFDAELYNDNYELINEAEAEITITDSEGRKYPFVFNRTEKAYYLNAGKLPVDNYSFVARVNRGDKLLTDNGQFTVSALNIEKTKTVADHNILFNLAESRGGAMVYPDKLDDLDNLLSSREDIKPVIYSEKRFAELLNYPLVMIILILLLGIEWFIRKRSGSY